MALSDAERQRRARERRAASIEEGEHVLRAADDMLSPAIAETIAALDLGPEHAAAVKLAERYAKVIDRADSVANAARWLGPLLLDVLGELGATPAARARMGKAGKPAPHVPDALDRLRSVRRQQFPGV